MRRSLLRGMVRQGMFPDERVVLFSDHKGNQLSTIVRDSDVTDIPGGLGLVEVRVIQEKGDIALIMLPGDVLGSRTMTVRNAELQFNTRNGHH